MHSSSVFRCPSDPRPALIRNDSNVQPSNDYKVTRNSYVAIAGMASVLVAMAIMPSHRAEFWTSTISIAVALLAYRFFRYGRDGEA